MSRPPLPEGFLEEHVLDSGCENGIWWFTYDAWWIGVVNGYAYIPEDHPLHGIGYDNLHDLIDAHGGLTFSRDGWIGFDTGHCWDKWPRGLRSDPFDLPWLVDDEKDANWTPGMVSEVARSLAARVAETAVRFTAESETEHEEGTSSTGRGHPDDGVQHDHSGEA